MLVRAEYSDANDLVNEQPCFLCATEGDVVVAHGWTESEGYDRKSNVSPFTCAIAREHTIYSKNIGHSVY